MTHTPSVLPFAAAAAAALGLALAGCSSKPDVAATTAPPVVASPSEIDAIAVLLDRGELGDARRRLGAALRGDPMNPSLLVLEQGILGDAKADLGPDSFAYTVAAGDTMAAIADRFLGNRLKSYQLARYNDLDSPAGLAPGQVLRIPGQPARATSERSVATRPAAGATAPARPRASVSPQVVPAPRPTDPAGAQRARTAGLAALNKGDVSQAVNLLQRASVLDPGNAAIERDLARARRIAGTVQSRR